MEDLDCSAVQLLLNSDDFCTYHVPFKCLSHQSRQMGIMYMFGVGYFGHLGFGRVHKSTLLQSESFTMINLWLEVALPNNSKLSLLISH
jgi:hypothetical protein